MHGNDYWIIAPILARSIQIDPLTMTVRSIANRAHSHAYNCYPLPTSVETTSVLLGVDTEATSHPTISISTPH